MAAREVRAQNDCPLRQFTFGGAAPAARPHTSAIDGHGAVKDAKLYPGGARACLNSVRNYGARLPQAACGAASCSTRGRTASCSGSSPRSHRSSRGRRSPTSSPSRKTSPSAAALLGDRLVERRNVAAGASALLEALAAGNRRHQDRRRPRFDLTCQEPARGQCALIVGGCVCSLIACTNQSERQSYRSARSRPSRRSRSPSMLRRRSRSFSRSTTCS